MLYYLYTDLHKYIMSRYRYKKIADFVTKAFQETNILFRQNRGLCIRLKCLQMFTILFIPKASIIHSYKTATQKNNQAQSTNSFCWAGLFYNDKFNYNKEICFFFKVAPSFFLSKKKLTHRFVLNDFLWRQHFHR